MGDKRDDDFREKPSWRELDRRKDRSRHVGQGDLSTRESPRWVRKQISSVSPSDRQKSSSERCSALN